MHGTWSASSVQVPGARIGVGTSATGDTAEAEPTDGDLLDRCRAGDAVAWDALVRRYERLVFSVALRNGLSKEDAADITQVTFVALLDGIERIREDDSLSFWLMTVCRRQAWRVRRHHEHEDVPGRAAIGAAGGPAPADTADPIGDWERVAVVHEALHRLGNPCRDLLVALYFDPAEPSYADIAARTGRAIGGIGPLRARCLCRLRGLLGEDDTDGRAQT